LAQQDVELMKLLIPVLRADITALETYVYKEEDPLDCPIYAFGGNSDCTTTAQDLEAWRLHTKRTFESKIFDGDHFFIRNNLQSVFSAILAKLSQVPQLAPVNR
jgi:medium-chain acyl-[acyl-carrier-protein] hydrolase